jgi:hypothetical protein
MALHAVPGAGALIITMEYDPDTGQAWCIMHDNACLAWLVDDTSAAEPNPVIVGSMPKLNAAAGPLWAAYAVNANTCFVPNKMRGTPEELFDLVAKGSGAQRPIYAKFADNDLAAAFNNWGLANASLKLKAPPQ